MKIGICQVSLSEGRYKENIETIEKSVKEHLKDKCDILCFPELCITGYDFNVAKENPVDERNAISQLAKKYNHALFAGISVKEGDSFYDVAGFWDESGNLLCEYKKIHLWGDERDFFSHGSCYKIFEYKSWRIGIIICADLGFSELTKAMALEGCDLVLCPTAWFKPFHEMLRLMVKARACENQMYVAAIDRASGDMPLCGHSLISDPMGETVAESLTEEEDYIEADISLDHVKEGKETIPWLQMRFPEMYNKWNL